MIVTQNVDDLHERAGSTNVIHLHGQLAWARGTSPRRLRRRIGAAPIRIGDLCEDGSQLRPDIVWFGEAVDAMGLAEQEMIDAAKVLVVGTSLTVYPAASLTMYAHADAEKAICALELEAIPTGYTLLQGTATAHIPGLVKRWLQDSPH